MYIWNGYTVIGKHKDLTEGMLKTLEDEQRKLEEYPSNGANRPSRDEHLWGFWQEKGGIDCKGQRLPEH